MILQETLLRQISRRERIQITSGLQVYLSLALLMTYVAGSTAWITYSFFAIGLSWLWIAMTLGLAFLFFPLFFWVCRLADIAVKGDVLMINQLFKPCSVTSVTSIRDIKTHKFLSLTFTRLTYYLDGKKGTICLVKRLVKPGTEPELIIRTLLAIN